MRSTSRRAACSWAVNDGIRSCRTKASGKGYRPSSYRRTSPLAKPAPWHSGSSSASLHSGLAGLLENLVLNLKRNAAVVSKDVYRACTRGARNTGNLCIRHEPFELGYSIDNYTLVIEPLCCSLYPIRLLHQCLKLFQAGPHDVCVARKSESHSCLAAH